MYRTINSVLLGLTPLAQLLFDAIKYDMRPPCVGRRQAHTQPLKKWQESDVSVVHGSSAHLARPDRLEPLARKLWALGP